VKSRSVNLRTAPARSGWFFWAPLVQAGRAASRAVPRPLQPGAGFRGGPGGIASGCPWSFPGKHAAEECGGLGGKVVFLAEQAVVFCVRRSGRVRADRVTSVSGWCVIFFSGNLIGGQLGGARAGGGLMHEAVIGSSPETVVTSWPALFPRSYCSGRALITSGREGRGARSGHRGDQAMLSARSICRLPNSGQGPFGDAEKAWQRAGRASRALLEDVGFFFNPWPTLAGGGQGARRDRPRLRTIAAPGRDAGPAR